MKDHYDFSKGYRNPAIAERLRNGYTRVVHHNSPDSGWDEVTFVTPEEVEEIRKKIEKARAAHFKNRVLAND